jgi:putative ABC transport system substrate-binding protein
MGLGAVVAFSWEGWMRRREFIAALGGAATWPLAARAQQPQNIRRIGILMPFPPGNAIAQERVRAFREELRKRGWASSVNLQFDERWTVDNMEQIHSAAENLVELKPDVILASGGRVIPILMKLMRSIPVPLARLDRCRAAADPLVERNVLVVALMHLPLHLRDRRPH